MTDVENVVSCLWKGFCEQILGQTPNWCVKRWAKRHSQAESIFETDIELANAQSMSKSKGAATPLFEFGSRVFNVAGAFQEP